MEKLFAEGTAQRRVSLMITLSFSPKHSAETWPIGNLDGLKIAHFTYKNALSVCASECL